MFISMTQEGFEFPEFWFYPPYFTVQPVTETLRKQTQLWSALILEYCKHTRTFIIDVGDERFELFWNRKIERRLERWEKRVFLDALVEEGNAQWLGESKDKALVLWKSLAEWAEELYAWCKSTQESVLMLDGLQKEMVGSQLEGIPVDEVYVPAIRLLEKSGRAKKFKSQSAVGVKILL
jgi:ESCRT-II complex subunit VPS25